ncbi:MAG: (4Fe-4S)-binding protein [Myxococcales bacterium]|nr:(4Fe-4S)-binding protein [Myxococcales bacterium]
MKELVVISGKGGTGKTSLVASFAALAGRSVIVDCDVDVPDLHLVLNPAVEHRQPFVGGKRARIRPGHCIACGKCEELCRYDAVLFDGPGNGAQARTFRVDEVDCEGCGVCAWFCAEKAIAFEPVVQGEWYRSATRYGPMLHARLVPPASNSGKLVSTLREEGRREAARIPSELILVDGSPGIGCPVIASLTGAALALVVTEPSLSGEHDLARVLALTRQLGVPAAVCVNRADIDEPMAQRIEARAREDKAAILPRVRFDESVTEAQMRGVPVVALRHSAAARDIERCWEELKSLLSGDVV